MTGQERHREVDEIRLGNNLKISVRVQKAVKQNMHEW